MFLRNPNHALLFEAYLTQGHGEVVRDLSADADHDTSRQLPLVDVQYTFEGKLLEVEPVRLVVVRTHLVYAADNKTKEEKKRKQGETRKKR